MSHGEIEKKPSPIRTFFPGSFLVATVAYCLLIYALSSQSSFPVSPPFAFFDKIAHFCLYGGLSAMVALGLHRARHDYSAPALVIIPVGFAVMYGLSDEIHQLFVAFRSFAVGDIAADAAGATAAAIFLLFVYRRQNSNN